MPRRRPNFRGSQPAGEQEAISGNPKLHVRQQLEEFRAAIVKQAAEFAHGLQQELDRQDAAFKEALRAKVLKNLELSTTLAKEREDLENKSHELDTLQAKYSELEARIQRMGALERNEMELVELENEAQEPTGSSEDSDVAGTQLARGTSEEEINEEGDSQPVTVDRDGNTASELVTEPPVISVASGIGLRGTESASNGFATLGRGELIGSKFVHEKRIWAAGQDLMVRYFHRYENVGNGCVCDHVFMDYQCCQAPGGFFSEVETGRDNDDNVKRLHLFCIAALEAPLELIIREGPLLGRRVLFECNIWQAQASSVEQNPFLITMNPLSQLLRVSLPVKDIDQNVAQAVDDLTFSYVHAVMIFMGEPEMLKVHKPEVHSAAQYRIYYRKVEMDPACWQPLDARRSFAQNARYFGEGGQFKIKIVDASEALQSHHLRYREFQSMSDKGTVEDFGWTKYVQKGVAQAQNARGTHMA